MSKREIIINGRSYIVEKGNGKEYGRTMGNHCCSVESREHFFMLCNREDGNFWN